jgi:hypothetical protein
VRTFALASQADHVPTPRTCLLAIPWVGLRLLPKSIADEQPEGKVKWLLLEKLRGEDVPFDHLVEGFAFWDEITADGARPNIIPVSTSTGCPSFM